MFQIENYIDFQPSSKIDNTGYNKYLKFFVKSCNKKYVKISVGRFK